MQSIWLELSVIIFASILGYIISRKLSQPVSIGLILLGIIIGPSLLSLVKYEDVTVIAQMGGIILLFLVGLETNFREIYTVKAMKVALAGVAAPLVLGFLVSILFGFNTIESFFIAAALTATSIGITAAVLKEMKKINTETAKLILGAAVIDDVLSLLVLSVAISLPTGLSIIPIVSTVIKSMVFIGIAVILSDKIMPRLVDFFDFQFGVENPKLTFMLAMVIAFGYSFIAEAIGLSAIVGAFLAGVSLARSRNVNLFESGAGFLEAIFTSIFFVSLGVIVSISNIFTNAWLIAALTIIAILSKFVGCGYAAYRLGYSKKDSAIIGTGMIPRGEVALIIGLYGLTLGIIGQSVYSSIIFMSFITTLIAPMLLKRLYSGSLPKKTIKKDGSVETL